MKRLIIVRHAKSDWAFNAVDFDRPLNHRGHKNAPDMALQVASKDIKPNLIVTSPAIRALTTAKYFAAAWGISEDFFKTEDRIYEASTTTLLDIINNFTDNANTIAIFGHNPGVNSIINYLTGKIISNIPTCSVAVLDFDFDNWELISGETAELSLFEYPKGSLD